MVGLARADIIPRPRHQDPIHRPPLRHQPVEEVAGGVRVAARLQKRLNRGPHGRWHIVHAQRHLARGRVPRLLGKHQNPTGPAAPHHPELGRLLKRRGAPEGDTGGRPMDAGLRHKLAERPSKQVVRPHHQQIIRRRHQASGQRQIPDRPQPLCWRGGPIIHNRQGRSPGSPPPPELSGKPMIGHQDAPPHVRHRVKRFHDLIEDDRPLEAPCHLPPATCHLCEWQQRFGAVLREGKEPRGVAPREQHHRNVAAQHFFKRRGRARLASG